VNIDIVDLVFVLGALALFRVCRPAVAVLSSFLGGWLLLPVGHFPAGSVGGEFPYWITGLAVPSDMLLTKAWVAPAAATLGSLAFDRPAWRALRPAWMDLPVVLWCAWPLLQGAIVADAHPAGWIASSYLLGCWGLPWLLGRLYFATASGQLQLIKGLAIAGVACLPFSLIEGAIGPVLYGQVYEPHPFRFDGAERYVGFRPMGLFEHGNQFGLWVCLCALAAVWLALAAPDGRAARWHRALAVIAVLIAFAAQSVGGILILIIGVAFLLASRYLRPRTMLVGAVAAMLLGGAVYVSGVVPIARLGKGSALGQHVIGVFQAMGRGSFTWRIAQDQKLLADAMAKPLTGSANWEWWRPKGIRPWGLTLLVIGQFGLVGLMLSLGTLLSPAVAAAWRAPRGSPWQMTALPLVLAAIAALTVLDATMNSFIFFPAIMTAGALATGTRRRGEIVRIPRRSGAHGV